MRGLHALLSAKVCELRRLRRPVETLQRLDILPKVLLIRFNASVFAPAIRVSCQSVERIDPHAFENHILLRLCESFGYQRSHDLPIGCDELQLIVVLFGLETIVLDKTIQGGDKRTQRERSASTPCNSLLYASYLHQPAER